MEMNDMTTKEKLAKAITFIKSIEKLNKKDYDVFKLKDVAKDAYAYCEDCGENVDVKLNWPRSASCNTEYIDYRIIDDLSDKAWHVLADIAE